MTFYFNLDVLKNNKTKIMKAIKLYCLLALIIIFAASCSSDNNDDGNNLSNFVIQDNCPQVPAGPISAYWEYAKGNPLPLNRVPILQNPQVSAFIHNQYTPFQIIPPQGYTAREYLNQNTAPLGVNIIRNDGAVVWRYVPISTYPINFSPDNVIDTEVTNVTNAFGVNINNATLMCEAVPKVFQENGITRVFRSRMIQFGNTIALVWVNITAVEGLPTLSVASSVSVAPANEFNNTVMEIFLPLSFQLLINDKGTLSDRDRDGTPDIYDREPDNPNVQ